PKELGHINDGTLFVASGRGSGMLTATIGELTAQVPITIVGDETGIALLNDSIINDTFRQYTVQLVNTSEGTTRPIDPTALTWTSSDNNIVTINPSTGVLQGIDNGIAFVTGTLADTAFTMKVIVEKPDKRVMPIEPVFDPTTWAISQSGGKNAGIETQGTSFSYTYTGASSRAPKIVLAKEVRLWSLPDTIRLRFNPGEVPFKSAVLSLKAGTNKTTYNTLTPDTVIADTPLTLNLPTDSWLDPSDMSNYPIILNSIQLNLGASTVGKQYTINFMGIETVYDNMPPIFPGDVNGDNAIDVKDVTAIITYILGDTPPDFNTHNANLNDDNDIDVQDVTALINLILQ
ncbi:MAG: dockerin type I repeat-containing protein, partial [Muribaculaceae bacterium]|nr:dockerin type I repeat-containing protein [Muribaculaceae bacterium]